ncbi:MAG: HEPN domain-containing protein [Spirochaetaceae bacterium]|nr:HEPN domain-containing protein [Spirochaetaceae bacterium]RKX82201.1 MAG: DNA-binding protein [Spirochaetota bacterium]
MPLDYNDWIKRAINSLYLAKVDKTENIVFEDLCFHAQQAVEKGLKAILIKNNVEPPRTHNLIFLLNQVSKIQDIPEKAASIINLEEYSVLTRYPGDYQPIGEDEYKASVRTAEEALGWIVESLENE